MHNWDRDILFHLHFVLFTVDKVKQWLFRPASPAVPKSDVQPEIFSEEVEGVQGVHIEIVDVLATPELGKYFKIFEYIFYTIGSK